MSKALVIAEKPSVASDIAKALGGFTKHDDYFERDDMLVASAVGHLLEIIVPEKYDVKRGKWSFANLPVIPPNFDLQPMLMRATQGVRVNSFFDISSSIRNQNTPLSVSGCSR
jgi:DNA topoisomerase IA